MTSLCAAKGNNAKKVKDNRFILSKPHKPTRFQTYVSALTLVRRHSQLAGSLYRRAY